MDRALYRSDRFEGRMRRARDLFGNLDRVDQAVDFRHRSTVRLRRYLEVHLHAVNVRPLHVRDANLDSRQSQCGWQSLEPCPVQPHVDEGAEEHVSRNAAGGVENRNFHLSEWRE